MSIQRVTTRTSGPFLEGPDSSLSQKLARLIAPLIGLFDKNVRLEQKMYCSLNRWKQGKGEEHCTVTERIKQCYQSHSETLDLRDSSVSSLPENLFLPRVKHLKLSDEQFTSFLKNPSSLYSLTSIKSFSVGERDPVNVSGTLYESMIKVSGTLYESMIKDSLDRWVLEGNPQAAADRILSCFKKNPPR